MQSHPMRRTYTTPHELCWGDRRDGDWYLMLKLRWLALSMTGRSSPIVVSVCAAIMLQFGQGLNAMSLAR